MVLPADIDDRGVVPEQVAGGRIRTSSGRLEPVDRADEIVVDQDVELMDDVGVIDVAADDDQVVVMAKLVERHIVYRRVVAGAHHGLDAGRRQDRGVVVSHERVLLDPVHDHQVACDLRHHPGGRESVRRGRSRAVGRRIDVLERRDVEALVGGIAQRPSVQARADRIGVAVRVDLNDGIDFIAVSDSRR